MVAHCAPLDDTAQEAWYCHACRMSRLDELFKQFVPTVPKGKGGNQRRIDDLPIVGKALAIQKSKGTESKIAAVREAMERHPDLVQGDATDENKAKRIARQM